MRAPARVIIDPGSAITFNAIASAGRVNLRVFTNHVDEGLAVPVPRELVIQANGPASSLRQAISEFHRVARPFTDVLAFCANAHVGLLEPHLAWDETDGESEREFTEVYLRDERGLPLPGRRLKLAETRSVLSLMSALGSAEAASLVGVLSRYGVALGHWHLGGETAAFTYLWFAVEALAKLIVSTEMNSGRSPEEIADEHGMPRNGGVSVRKLEAFVRRRVIFQGDAVTHDEAFEISNGLEHASVPLAGIHSRTAVLAPKVFAIIREAVLRFLDPDLSATDGLLEGLVALPLDTIQRRIVHGEFINVENELAHPDLLYPVLEWRPRVASLVRTEEGDYNATFTDTMTVRCAPGVEFRATSYEIAGRADGSAGQPPSGVSLTANVGDSSQDPRDQILRFLEQVQKVLRSLGPGESGAEYSQPSAHLLEIYNMMRSTYRGCVLLAARGLPDEALILGQAVFRDAMRLQEAASMNTQRRAALAIGWKSDSLDAVEEILLGDGSGNDYAESVSTRRSVIRQAAQTFNVEDLTSFSSPRRVAEQLADDDYLNIDRMVRALAEGWDLLTLSRRNMIDDVALGLHDSAVNDWAYPLVAKYVAGGCLIGAQAAMTIFGWTDQDALVAEASEELERLEALLADGDDD